MTGRSSGTRPPPARGQRRKKRALARVEGVAGWLQRGPDPAIRYLGDPPDPIKVEEARAAFMKAYRDQMRLAWVPTSLSEAERATLSALEERTDKIVDEIEKSGPDLGVVAPLAWVVEFRVEGPKAVQDAIVELLSKGELVGTNVISAATNLISNTLRRRVLTTFAAIFNWNLTRIAEAIGSAPGTVSRMMLEAGLGPELDEARRKGLLTRARNKKS